MKKIIFTHNGQTFYRGGKSGAWATDPKGQNRLTAEEAAPIEAALQEALKAREERREERKEWGKNVAAAIQSAQRVRLDPYLDYLAEVERAESRADGRSSRHEPDALDPNDALHETGAATHG